MPRIQRHRAASGQGRALRGPLRKAGRADKQHPAESGAGANQGKAGSPKAAAKATPSPRKAEPARAAAPVDRSKAVKPEANGKPRQKSRVVRAVPELAREDGSAGAAAKAKGKVRRPARHGLSGPPRPAAQPKGVVARPAASAPPRRRPTEAPRYIAFHKPYGVLSQFTCESGHRALAEFNLPADVYAVGRLDMDSEGLLLLSNDGTFINRLLNPTHGHERTYLVQVEGEPSEEALQALRDGRAGARLRHAPRAGGVAGQGAVPAAARSSHPRAPPHTGALAADYLDRGPQPPGPPHDGGRGASNPAAGARVHRCAGAWRSAARPVA